VSDHLDLITVQGDRLDERDALVHGEGVADQPLPGWMFAAHEKAVELTGVQLLE
jgi:hypothetical protein